MSLLDDVSIVVTPNGYKAGELYAVVPVPTEGAEEITNGDFATDTDWTKGTGWTISGGTANCNNTSGSTQDLKTENRILNLGGKTVKIEFTVSNYSGSATMIVTLQGTGGNDFTGINANGTYTAYASVQLSENSIDLLFKASNGWIGSIDNVSVKEYTSADMDVTRTTDATRVDENGLIEDVLSNVPRIDYTGGGCPHILSEPQRTNLITYSSDFSQSYWIKQSNITPTYNTTETLSPDGTYNATKLVGNGTDGIYKASISITGVAARSVYLKSVTGTVNVILKDPNLTVTSPTLDVTTEWQRFELTADNGSGGQGIWVDDIPASGIYIWGAQVEESYPTSYIPTSGSTVTRNQDIFTRDGIGSLINSPEGVLFVEMAALSDDGTLRCITLSDGGITNRVLIIYNTTSNSIRAVVVSNAGTSFDELHTVTSTLDFHKIAIKWKLNDFAFWIDGVEVATDTSGAAPIGLDRIVFDVGNGTYDFYGKVKQLQVYNTALTDEQLEALTS
jgi:hypothetical protein